MTARSLTIFAAALAAATTFCAAQPLEAQHAAIGKPLAREAVLSVLAGKLDTRKSKVGDAVIAKTLNPLKLNDGSVIPRGSTIVGRVTQVQSKAGGGAILAIAFVRVEKKDSSEVVPVHGLLVAVAPLPSLSDAGGSTEDLPLGSGGDSKGAMTALTGTPINGSGSPLPPIKPGCGIKGVVLGSMPSADGSSVLQSTEKDFKVENGTRLEIGLTSP